LILRSLANDCVLHDRIAKMINDRSDREDAAKPLAQVLLGHD
jgi:hypothetical protein